jgi:hypothetical protein
MHHPLVAAALAEARMADLRREADAVRRLHGPEEALDTRAYTRPARFRPAAAGVLLPALVVTVLVMRGLTGLPA